MPFNVFFFLKGSLAPLFGNSFARAQFMIKAYRCKIDTFCTRNYCPVRKIHTGTQTFKCKVFTSHKLFSNSLWTHTQQNITDNLLRHSNLLWLLIHPEFGHEFSLCVQWEQRGGVYKCGASSLNVEKGCVHQRNSVCSPAHISLTFIDQKCPMKICPQLYINILPFYLITNDLLA